MPTEMPKRKPPLKPEPRSSLLLYRLGTMLLIILGALLLSIVLRR